MTPEKLKTRINIGLVLIIILLAFGAAGSGDYADALEAENARIQAAADRCRMAVTLREVTP